MTHDERALEMVSKLPAEVLDVGGYGFRFEKPSIFYPRDFYRYWLKTDGSIWRWRMLSHQWMPVHSPRMRTVLKIAAWPKWQAEEYDYEWLEVS